MLTLNSSIRKVQSGNRLQQSFPIDKKEDSSKSLSLPQAWYPLRYHPTQAKLWSFLQNRTKKYISAVAGRGSGKTEIARRFIVQQLAYKKPWPDPLFAYCLPTYPQAKKVAWYPLIQLIPPQWIAKDGINKTESTITTIFGSKLYIVGMDKPYRIEGLQFDDIVLDESSDQRPGTFSKTVVPMLTHRNGRCIRIGVPKKSGVGRVDFKLFFENGLPTVDGVYNHPTQASFWWPSEDILTPQQIEEAKGQLDEQEYNEQFRGQWIDSGGTIYYSFSKGNNLADVSYSPGETIIVGCDFNVNPMCWILSHFKDGKLFIFDEIFLRDTNTPAALDHLHKTYGIVHAQNNGDFVFCGDASAHSRKTSATRTDYLIIKNDIRFGNKKVFFPQKNPQTRDRYACVNAALCNAESVTRILISTRCKHLINDLMAMSYKEGTTEPEDYTGTDIGHTSDALGYVVFKYMPIKLARIYSPVVITSN